MVSLHSRIGKLEQVRGSAIGPVVVVMADGHSRDEIGAFLKSEGIQDKGRQPMIIFNGGRGENTNASRRSLRIG